MTTGYFNTKVVRNLHEFSHLWEAQNIRKNNTHKAITSNKKLYDLKIC